MDLLPWVLFAGMIFISGIMYWMYGVADRDATHYREKCVRNLIDYQAELEKLRKALATAERERDAMAEACKTVIAERDQLQASLGDVLRASDFWNQRYRAAIAAARQVEQETVSMQEKS